MDTKGEEGVRLTGTLGLTSMHCYIQNRQLVRTSCGALALLRALWGPRWEGDLKIWGDTWIWVNDSLCYTAKTNATL